MVPKRVPQHPHQLGLRHLGIEAPQCIDGGRAGDLTAQAVTVGYHEQMRASVGRALVGFEELPAEKKDLAS